uniref:Uncharacterized protein n=1 Tax=Globodera rostochiensis TaxID=31243 RepID=A0A914HVG9_GLORO
MKFLIALQPARPYQLVQHDFDGPTLLTVAFETTIFCVPPYHFIRCSRTNSVTRCSNCWAPKNCLFLQRLIAFASYCCKHSVLSLNFKWSLTSSSWASSISIEQSAESASISSAGSPLAAKAAVSYELRELALEALVDMWRLSGTRFQPALCYFSTHILSLDTVLAVVDLIESNCAARQLKGFSGKSQIGIEEEINNQIRSLDHIASTATAHTIEQLTEEPHFPRWLR